LQKGDASLVNEIAENKINGRNWNFYSFATKYCSQHKPTDYPIYDNYVQRTLIYFNRNDKFSSFTQEDMRIYQNYKNILVLFRKHYNLGKYDFKQLDKYLWLLGKDYFTITYNK